MSTESQVIEAEDDGVAEDVTTTAGGVAEEATPDPQQGIDVEQLKSEYETKLQAASQDLNKLKSTLQKQQAEQARQYEEKQRKLEKQLQEVRMSNMDEGQRKQYEEQLATEEYQNLQTQLQQLSQKNQELSSSFEAQNFFLKNGVPAEQLVLDQGYDVLVNSGWQYLLAEIERLKNPSTQTTQAKTRKTAPSVVTDKAPASGGTTWADLRKIYGSDENVYLAVENGTLDPSILPAK